MIITISIIIFCPQNSSDDIKRSRRRSTGPQLSDGTADVLASLEMITRQVVRDYPSLSNGDSARKVRMAQIVPKFVLF